MANTEKIRIRISGLLALVLWAGMATAQPAPRVTDNRETMLWVQRQADRIETVLHDAVRSQEPLNLLLKMHWAWREFDAVAQAGVYCHAAREAAEHGRAECDLLNNERKQDANSMLIRAVEAREFALRMRRATADCFAESEQNAATGVNTVATFAPRDVLYRDAEIVELDLSDAKSTKDFHIIAQKIEHSMRVLRDAEQLAASMGTCEEALEAARAAMASCREALLSKDFDTAAPHIGAAMEHTLRLRNTSVDCR